jgi:hypothetical protein
VNHRVNPGYSALAAAHIGIVLLPDTQLEEEDETEGTSVQSPGSSRHRAVWSILRRDPTLANRPPSPSREFKARPLPAMYGGGGGGSRVGDETLQEHVGLTDGGARPKVKA